MGTNCAPLVADLFLFCYERDFMMSLSDDKQAKVIDAFNTTSRYYGLISKFQYGIKSLLRQGLSEPDFYGDLVYKLKKITGSNNFSVQFIKIISHYKKIGHKIYVLQQTACLVVNPITVGNFAFLFNCTPMGRTSDSMMVLT